jgi:hypothetical protein
LVISQKGQKAKLEKQNEIAKGDLKQSEFFCVIK